MGMAWLPSFIALPVGFADVMLGNEWDPITVPALRYSRCTNSRKTTTLTPPVPSNPDQWQFSCHTLAHVFSPHQK